MIPRVRGGDIDPLATGLIAEVAAIESERISMDAPGLYAASRIERVELNEPFDVILVVLRNSPSHSVPESMVELRMGKYTINEDALFVELKT